MSGSKSSVPGVNAAEIVVAAREVEPLSFTVHSMPRPNLDERSRKRMGRLKMILVLLVCAAPVIASYFTFVLGLVGLVNWVIGSGVAAGV